MTASSGRKEDGTHLESVEVNLDGFRRFHFLLYFVAALVALLPGFFLLAALLAVPTPRRGPIHADRGWRPERSYKYLPSGSNTVSESPGYPEAI